MTQAKCDNLLRWYVYVEGRDRPLVTWAESADAARIKGMQYGHQVRSVVPAPPLLEVNHPTPQ
jgi:hypothetical protein